MNESHRLISMISGLVRFSQVRYGKVRFGHVWRGTTGRLFI